MYVFHVGIQEVNRSYIMFTALMQLFQIEATVCIEHIFQSHEDFRLTVRDLGRSSASDFTVGCGINKVVKVKKWS